MTDQVHYVGFIKIQKVTKTMKGNGMFQESKRDVTEVTTITIQADSIKTLKEKIGAHISLVED